LNERERGERRREGEEVRERARARSPVAVVGKAAADRWCASDRGHLARCFFLFPPVEETQEKLGNKKKWEETSLIPTRSSSLLYRVERNKKYKKTLAFSCSSSPPPPSVAVTNCKKQQTSTVMASSSKSVRPARS